MIYTYPDYYDKFTCIAGACPATCCSAWEIVIDEESLEKYSQYEGEYKNTLQKNIKWKKGVFKHDKCGKCAFLRRDNLCDIYANMGKDSLCTTCREYPRHKEEYENVREISLSLSCPVVADILLTHEDKVSFFATEDQEEEVFEDFDYFLFSNLEDIREEIFAIAQDRTKNIRNRIFEILRLGGSAQRHYENGTLISWEDWDKQDEVCVSDEFHLLKKHLSFLAEELELLYDEWDDVLTDAYLCLFCTKEETYLFDRTEIVKYGKGVKAFEENRQLFLAWWKNSGLLSIDILLEQILVYFISIYFLGAVYDENIVGKTDAAAGHTTVIFLLLMACWVQKGDAMTFEDVKELVYRYSREIEHSDYNLEQAEVLPWFERKPGEG